jgi:hypothetical protein
MGQSPNPPCIPPLEFKKHVTRHERHDWLLAAATIERD